MDLTPRQALILKTLIEEYTNSAEAIGSETLEQKYNLGISPATIRNEMAILTKTGYLKQPHTSAGRIPTARALRFYVDQLMEEKKLSLADEVKAKQRITDAKSDLDHVMQEATRALAEDSKMLSLGAVDGEDSVWHSGYANILSIPEFYNIDVTAHVLSLIEQMDRVRQLLFQEASEPLSVLFGEELGWSYFEPIGIVSARFKVALPSGEKTGCLGVIGPARLPFAYIIPRVRYFGGLISEVMGR